MGKFVIKETPSGYKFDLKAGNGEVIATSQVYTAEDSCKGGIESVRKCCTGEIEDQTIENYEPVKHPKYEVYVDKAGEYRFRNRIDFFATTTLKGQPPFYHGGCLVLYWFTVSMP